MKNESISHQAARSSIWTAVEKFSTLGIQFIVSLVLARFLLPSHYGMVAMLSVFIGIGFTSVPVPMTLFPFLFINVSKRHGGIL